MRLIPCEYGIQKKPRIRCVDGYLCICTYMYIFYEPFLCKVATVWHVRRDFITRLSYLFNLGMRCFTYTVRMYIQPRYSILQYTSM